MQLMLPVISSSVKKPIWVLFLVVLSRRPVMTAATVTICPS